MTNDTPLTLRIFHLRWGCDVTAQTSIGTEEIVAELTWRQQRPHLWKDRLWEMRPPDTQLDTWATGGS